MKHFLKIWALLMLFIHLSSLAFVSFLPGATAGVSLKKVCLRQQAEAKVSASTDVYPLQNLFSLKVGSTESQKSETEGRLCSVKLFCTPATSEAAFAYPPAQYLEPGFMPVAYFSLTSPTEPDPPKFS